MVAQQNTQINQYCVDGIRQFVRRLGDGVWDIIRNKIVVQYSEV